MEKEEEEWKRKTSHINGIGDKKAKALLKHFKTISAIKSSSVDDLLQVKGISEKNAQDIVSYYANL